MRKKIGFAFAAILTVAALQWAVASVDTQPAATQQVVSGKTVSADAKTCPTGETASCPKGAAGCDKAASASCPTAEGAKCDKGTGAGCPKGEATTTSTGAASCPKTGDAAKCPYSSGTTTKS